MDAVRVTTSTDQRLGIEVDRWRVPAAYVIATVGSVVAAGILLPFRTDVAHTLEAFFFLVPVVVASGSVAWDRAWRRRSSHRRSSTSGSSPSTARSTSSGPSTSAHSLRSWRCRS